MTPDTAELTATFDKGIQLPQIRALLSQARERAGLPAESVCTLNLVAVHFSEAGYERGKAGIEGAAALHPARIIQIIAEPKGGPASVTVRVSMVRPRGGPQPLEQLVLTARGSATRLLESAVTGLLVPEVPLVVVWGGRPEGDLLRHASESADRVLIDSGTRPLQALVDVAALLARGAPIGDLAWARLYPWQALAADVLDLPNLRQHRGNITSVRITTSGEPGPEAALLAGWFGSRVRKARVELVAGPPLEAEKPEPSPGADAASGSAVPSSGSAVPSSSSQLPASGSQLPASGFQLPAPPPPEPMVPGSVTELRFEAPPALFRLHRERGILIAQISGDDDGEVLHRVRLPPCAPGLLLAMELKLLSGQDEIYAAAMAQAARLVLARGAQVVSSSGGQ